MINANIILDSLIQSPEESFTGKHDDVMCVIEAAIKRKINFRVEHVPFMEFKVTRFKVEIKAHEEEG